MKYSREFITEELLRIGEKEYRFGVFGMKILPPVWLGLNIVILILHSGMNGNLDSFLDAVLRWKFYYLETLQFIGNVVLYALILAIIVAVICRFAGLRNMGIGYAARWEELEPEETK